MYKKHCFLNSFNFLGSYFTVPQTTRTVSNQFAHSPRGLLLPPV